MRFAETGFNLFVDLSAGTVRRVATDPRLTTLHLGGQGTGAKILWDEVGPEVEPFSPENLLIFSTGLLHGTPVPGANRTSVSTISPLTGLYVNSLMGGWFGPELKYAGYDKIIVRGRSPPSGSRARTACSWRRSSTPIHRRRATGSARLWATRESRQ